MGLINMIVMVGRSVDLRRSMIKRLICSGGLITGRINRIVTVRRLVDIRGSIIRRLIHNILLMTVWVIMGINRVVSVGMSVGKTRGLRCTLRQADGSR